MGEANYFIVASRGLTATTWFAKALGRHASIFCCHGRDRPERGPETEDLLFSKEYRDDRLCFEKRQRKMNILSYLDMVSNASTGQKIVGNVHGFVLTELIDKLKRAGLYGKVQIANMVRNPITFIESYTALVCQRKYDYPEKYYSEHFPRAQANRELLKNFGFLGQEDIEICGFAEACQALAKMEGELDVDNVPIILMEQIVNDANYFRNMAKHLTKGMCFFSNDILTKIFSQGKINSHRGKIELIDDRKKITSAEKTYKIWNAWSKDKKDLFNHFLDKNHIKKFMAFGYDLSFV